MKKILLYCQTTYFRVQTLWTFAADNYGTQKVKSNSSLHFLIHNLPSHSVESCDKECVSFSVEINKNNYFFEVLSVVPETQNKQAIYSWTKWRGVILCLLQELSLPTWNLVRYQLQSLSLICICFAVSYQKSTLGYDIWNINTTTLFLSQNKGEQQKKMLNEVQQAEV